MVDLTKATQEAQGKMNAAVRDVMPRWSFPSTRPPEPEVDLGQVWQGMTGRDILGLAKTLGEDKAARFVGYMMRRGNG